MSAGGRLARRSGCCIKLGIIQFAHPGRFAVAATTQPLRLDVAHCSNLTSPASERLRSGFSSVYIVAAGQAVCWRGVRCRHRFPIVRLIGVPVRRDWS